jgi:hypothetical protein
VFRCARFFEAQRIPVLGAIFNKCPPTGFYGRDACDRYIRQYFASRREPQHVYGVLPAVDGLDTGAEEACSFAFKRPEVLPAAGPLTEADQAAVEQVAELFQKYVDVKVFLDDLEAASAKPTAYVRTLQYFPGTQTE